MIMYSKCSHVGHLTGVHDTKTKHQVSIWLSDQGPIHSE